MSRKIGVVNTSVEFPEGMWERAKILAARKRISLTELVRQAVKCYLSGDYVDCIEIDEHGNVFPPEGEACVNRITEIRASFGS